MKLPFAAVAACLVCLIIGPVSAQTSPPAAPAAPTGTVPVPATKRVTCLGTTQNLKGRTSAISCSSAWRRRGSIV